MIQNSELKTEALVLRRTNIGEADRLLDLLTPKGKITAKARSVRKEKSRLAGGIEMFCLSEVTLHHSQKNNLNTLTSSKMLRFYQGILSDLSRLECGSEILRQISRAADQVDTPDYFDLVKQSFEGLDEKLSVDLVFTWFYFNFARIKGEQINLITDVSGEKLKPDRTYVWDSTDAALRPLTSGRIHADEIKAMRLILSAPLKLVSRVKNLDLYLPEILHIAKSVNVL